MLSEAAEFLGPTGRVATYDLDDRIRRFRLRQGRDPHRGQIALLEAIRNALAGTGPREILLHTGKRAGKTTAMMDEVAEQVERNPQSMVWIAGPTYDPAEKIFDAVTAGWKGVTNKQPKQARFGEQNVGRIKCKSWQNLNTIEGDGVHLLILEEAQNLTHAAYTRFQARTKSTKGITIMVGSPLLDSTYFLEMIELAKQPDSPIAYVYFPTEMNPLPELQETLAEAKELMKPEDYSELYLGIPVRNQGVVFPEFSHTENVISPLLPVEGLPITLAVDPGRYKYAVLALQFIENSVFIVDELFSEDATDVGMIQEVMERPWWPQVQDLVIDIASKAKRAETAKSTWENWEGLANLRGRMQFVPVDAGTKRLSQFIRDPRNGRRRLFLDPEVAKRTMLEFNTYRKNAVGQPVDAYNDCIKALTYAIVDRFDLVDKREIRRDGDSRVTFYANWRGNRNGGRGRFR